MYSWRLLLSRILLHFVEYDALSFWWKISTREEKYPKTIYSLFKMRSDLGGDQFSFRDGQTPYAINLTGLGRFLLVSFIVTRKRVTLSTTPEEVYFQWYVVMRSCLTFLHRIFYLLRSFSWSWRGCHWFFMSGVLFVLFFSMQSYAIVIRC